MKRVSVDDLDLEDLFSYEDSTDEHLENIRDKNITHYRTKTIKSGEMLECEIYPIWNTRNSIRKAKENVSRLAQKRLNEKNALKNAIRLINANFTDKDIWATFTYSNARIPKSEKDALRFMQNYIRRLKYYCEKHKYKPLKYFCVTEYSDDPKRKIRIHHHIIMNFPDRDVAEKMWKGGARTQSRRLQADDYGYEGLTRYMLKDTAKDLRKRYMASKNLKKPKVYIADRKISRRRVMEIATAKKDAKQIFERIYKNYDFKDYKVKTSPYVTGAYLYVRMRLRL